jgi:hypothetical protein
MDPQEFLEIAREVDAFASLNYSKTKRITAVDVEQHLRSKGFLCPRNDLPDQFIGQMELPAQANPTLHKTPAPGNRVKV